MQNRLRSKTAWMAILSLTAFVSKTYLNYEIPQVNEFIDLILLTASAVGIFNNPTNADKF